MPVKTFANKIRFVYRYRDTVLVDASRNLQMILTGPGAPAPVKLWDSWAAAFQGAHHFFKRREA